MSNRVLGFPIRPGPHRSPGAEQHVMGLPAEFFDHANLEGLRFLAHPVREYKRWAQRRRPDAGATGGTVPPAAGRPEDRWAPLRE